MPCNCKILVNIRPIGPWPATSDGVAGQQVQAVDGLEDGVDGFEHGAFGEGISGGDFHDAGQDEGHARGRIRRSRRRRARTRR